MFELHRATYDVTTGEEVPISRRGTCTDIPIIRAHPTEHGVQLGFTRYDLWLDHLMEEVLLSWPLTAAAEAVERGRMRRLPSCRRRRDHH